MRKQIQYSAIIVHQGFTTGKHDLTRVELCRYQSSFLKIRGLNYSMAAIDSTGTSGQSRFLSCLWVITIIRGCNTRFNYNKNTLPEERPLCFLHTNSWRIVRIIVSIKLVPVFVHRLLLLQNRIYYYYVGTSYDIMYLLRQWIEKRY